MPKQGAHPVRSQLILNELKKFDVNLHQVDLPTYLEKYRQWIYAGKNNKITGLENYQSSAFVHGTIQAFDHFYIRHCNKRFRFYKGEFMYHRAVLKHGLNWQWINEEDIVAGDAVLISCPFSDTGKTHSELEYILDRCEKLNVPVLIDLAYLPTSKNIHINLNYDCIDTVCTSISKMFEGAQYIRTGIRFMKQNIDDGIDVFNSVGMVHTYSMSLASYVMDNFSIDYCWDNYEQQYNAVINTLTLEPTDCIMFGTSQTEYFEFNRGNSHNRVCISDEISNLL